jgi:hypothetical protein
MKDYAKQEKISLKGLKKWDEINDRIIAVETNCVKFDVALPDIDFPDFHDELMQL